MTRATEVQSENLILTRPYADEEIVIGSTTGKRTFAKAKDVFTGFIDPDFKIWNTDEKSEATKPTPVIIYDVRKGDVTFRKMFSSLGDPDDLVLTQDQVIEFCENYFIFSFFVFLFKVRGKILVAGIYRIGDASHGANVYRFKYFNIQFSQHWQRLVVPRL